MAPTQEEIFDSPSGWVAKHIRRYVETDGEEGHRWRGVNTLLLTTRGRRSGKLRRTALIYGRDADRYLVVGSQGGADEHPFWYRNLVENHDVEVQVGADTFPARARTATAEEKLACCQPDPDSPANVTVASCVPAEFQSVPVWVPVFAADGRKRTGPKSSNGARWCAWW